MHGRGIQELVTLVWLKMMTGCARVNIFISDLVGIDLGNDEHVEAGKSRTIRDTADFTHWLNI
jgi:hypothetical protein